MASRFRMLALSAATREAYLREWQNAETRFFEDPDGGIADADRLIQLVLAARGYPVGEFEVHAEVLAVDHPEVVQDYREAHAVALLREVGEADDEDVRRAMQVYRMLFERLSAPDPEPAAG